MTHNTEVEEWRKKLKTIYDGLYVGHDSGYSDDIYLSSAPDYELKKLEDFIHHQLQKARHDWLREEIVRLEVMKREIDYIPTPHGYDVNERDFGFNQALQTIIDRYQAELDQDNNTQV